MSSPSSGAARLLVFGCVLALAAADSCSMDDSQRRDCGHIGTQQPDCEASGCCWKPGAPGSQVPWCFYSSNHTSGCNHYIMNATSPGFTDDFYQKMYTDFTNNLNIKGSGAVVAAPDQNTPGGSYYYHWMRDGALSMKTYIDLNDGDYDTIKEVTSAYVGWVSKVQQQKDPNDIDVRTEPKFMIPSGQPYTGGWCRPQTDGPALRANTLVLWANVLLKNNMAQEAHDQVWPLIANDLEWVTQNWQNQPQGCDLWEEVRSTDFFWNRMAYVYSLNNAAALAKQLQEKVAEELYSTSASDINDALRSHWNGNYLTESDNRPLDGSVLHAVATFGQDTYAPTSSETASTIQAYTQAFCQEYPINSQDTANGIPGVLIGRYPGDHYAGGNPWQLLSAALAEVYYLGAQTMYQRIEQAGDFRLSAAGDRNHTTAWAKLLELDAKTATAKDLAAASVAAGDSVLTRIWHHVQADGGRIDEQIDKNTGAQASAKGLTWSYANILHALHLRKKLGKMM